MVTMKYDGGDLEIISEKALVYLENGGKSPKQVPKGKLLSIFKQQ